jgi:hypothetical protein
MSRVGYCVAEARSACIHCIEGWGKPISEPQVVVKPQPFTFLIEIFRLIYVSFWYCTGLHFVIKITPSSWLKSLKCGLKVLFLGYVFSTYSVFLCLCVRFPRSVATSLIHLSLHTLQIVYEITGATYVICVMECNHIPAPVIAVGFSYNQGNAESLLNGFCNSSRQFLLSMATLNGFVFLAATWRSTKNSMATTVTRTRHSVTFYVLCHLVSKWSCSLCKGYARVYTSC